MFAAITAKMGGHTIQCEIRTPVFLASTVIMDQMLHQIIIQAVVAERLLKLPVFDPGGNDGTHFRLIDREALIGTDFISA